MGSLGLILKPRLRMDNAYKDLYYIYTYFSQTGVDWGREIYPKRSALYAGSGTGTWEKQAISG